MTKVVDVGVESKSPSSILMSLVNINHELDWSDFDDVVKFLEENVYKVIDEVHGLDKLLLDDGAVSAVILKGKSLLPAGIIPVEGKFEANESVSICDRNGKEIARGITNYSSNDILRILGSQSEDIPKLLGVDGEETVVHRDNLVGL